MSKTSAERIRQWTGPALLSFGFRPFFLFGALWAMIAMLVWIFLLTGLIELPSTFDPVTWHAHEFLFGYVSAIVAGFLLTAVPNWTGRLPVVGWTLGGLVVLWILGRIAIAISAILPMWLTITADLSFLTVFSLLILREIIVGKNWRNLIVMGLLAILLLANVLFHWEVADGNFAAQGIGLRLGLAATLMMISVIGGRIVPSFTRNWLVRTGREAKPTPPMQDFDKATLLATFVALLSWVFLPEQIVTGILLLIVGGLQVVRLSRWKGTHTFAEPLVWVLHVGYAFVPLGALLMGVSLLVPNAFGLAAAQHVWMAGGIGLMTLAVMSRATLGHTGRELHAGAGTTVIYLAMILAVFARLAAAVWPDLATPFYHSSALFWMVAFGGFVVLYGPLLIRPKPE